MQSGPGGLGGSCTPWPWNCCLGERREREEFIPLLSTRFPRWDTPKSLPGGTWQLIPLLKCCSYPRLPKSFPAGVLTARIVNFSEFQSFPPTFQSGSSTPRAPGQGSPRQQQHWWNRGRLPGPSQPCSPGITGAGHGPLSPGDLQDPPLSLCPACHIHICISNESSAPE